MVKAVMVMGMDRARPFNWEMYFLAQVATKIGACAVEQGDLGKGVVGNVDRASGHGVDRNQGKAQGDIGELADRGVGESRLEVVMGQGDHRGNEDGGGKEICAGQDQAELVHQFRSIDVIDHPGHAKDPHLDHSHGMEQGGYRRGGHHGRGQPGVQRITPDLAIPAIKRTKMAISRARVCIRRQYALGGPKVQVAGRPHR